MPNPREAWTDGLPPDDYLAAARRADLALARRELAACRRPVPEPAVRDIGPTEAWLQYLADTDPEWTAEVLVLPVERAPEAAA
jgi:hypothetical protein